MASSIDRYGVRCLSSEPVGRARVHQAVERLRVAGVGVVARGVHARPGLPRAEPRGDVERRGQRAELVARRVGGGSCDPRTRPRSGRRAPAGAPRPASPRGRAGACPARGARWAATDRAPRSARREPSDPSSMRACRAFAAACRTRSTRRHVGEPVPVAHIELQRRRRQRQVARRRVVRVADEELARARDAIPRARRLGVDVVVEQPREQQRRPRVHPRRRDVHLGPHGVPRPRPSSASAAPSSHATARNQPACASSRSAAPRGDIAE